MPVGGSTTATPVSSATSRITAWSGGSPAAQRPPGISSLPRTGSPALSRRCSNMLVRSSDRTMAATFGTTRASPAISGTFTSTHSSSQTR